MRFAAFGLPEQGIATFGPGSFLGELDMLTGPRNESRPDLRTAVAQPSRLTER